MGEKYLIPNTTLGEISSDLYRLSCADIQKQFFQALVASIFNINPRSICPRMIFKHSGQAPKPFPCVFHGMSSSEMSGHDTQGGSFDLIFFPTQILCVHRIIRFIYSHIYIYTSIYQVVLRYKYIYMSIYIRVIQKNTFLKLSFALLTTHAIGLQEVTKKFQRYRQ